jgi:hypothetical protein
MNATRAETMGVDAACIDTSRAPAVLALFICAFLRVLQGLWGRIFIPDFAYISRKFHSDGRLFLLKTKKYLGRHPADS